jgi:hypothetical protein
MPAERQDHPARTAAGRSFRALPKMVGGKVIDGDGDMRVLDGTKMERAATPAELKLSRKLRALAKGGGGKRRTRGPVTRRTRDRLVVNGTVYEITGAMDPDGRRHELVVLCWEVQA